MNSAHSGPNTYGPGALIIVSLATFLALVVFTAPLTTLNAMTADLTLSSALQAWIMSAMPLGAACGLLTAGALGDTFGRRRTFVGGLWLTVVSSIAAALATDGAFLIVMRIVQGLGSAAIMACGLGLLSQVYQGLALRRAAGIWAAALGGGVAAGPIIASLLLFIGGWAGIHWLITVASAVLGYAATKGLPQDQSRGGRIDLIGSILLMVGLACLLSAMIEVRVGTPVVVASLFGAGVLVIGGFVAIELRLPHPLVMLDLFRYADFTGATIAAFASGAGVLALMSLVPTVLVRGLGMSPLSAAFVLLGWSGITVLSALGARYLPVRFSSRQLVIGSILGCAVGQSLLLAIDANTGWFAALPGLVVAGICNGILNASLGHEAVRTVPAERAAMGSAVNNTARYLGSALGIALVSVLISARTNEGFFAGWHEAVVASAMLSLIGVIAMAVLSRRNARGSAGAAD